MELILQGSLKHFRLSEMLNFFHREGKSGTLRMVSTGREAVFYLDGGSIVFAKSNQDQFGLGILLLRKKKINRGQRDSLEELMLHEGEKYAQAAVKKGVFSADELRDFSKIQVSEVVYDALAWDGGTFSMMAELQLPDYAVPVTVELDELLSEGESRRKQAEHWNSVFPEPSVVFRVIGDPEDQDKITLSPAQFKVLFKFNGKTSLEELVEATDDRDANEIYQIVHDLRSNKLIEEVPGDEVEKPAAPPARRKKMKPVADEPIQPIAEPEPPPAPAPAPQPVRSAAQTTAPQPVPAPAAAAAVEPERAPEPQPVTPTPAAPPPPTAPMPAMPISAQKSEPPPTTEVVPTPTTSPETEAPTVACLTVDNAEKTSYPLYDESYTVGREPGNAIQIADSSVSGAHARIIREGPHYVIEDLKSRNGTFVNGERVDRRVLRENDKIRLGKVHLIYNIAAESKPQMATMFEAPRPS